MQPLGHFYSFLFHSISVPSAFFEEGFYAASTLFSDGLEFFLLRWALEKNHQCRSL
jgi:hypothetical protein